MSACRCVKTHSPPAPKVQKHHVIPRAWQGLDTPENTELVCGTTHDATHDLLNRAVRDRAFPTDTTGYGRYAVTLARRGIDGYLAQSGGTWPTKLTAERS